MKRVRREGKIREKFVDDFLCGGYGLEIVVREKPVRNSHVRLSKKQINSCDVKR